jgi:phasin
MHLTQYCGAIFIIAMQHKRARDALPNDAGLRGSRENCDVLAILVTPWGRGQDVPREPFGRTSMSSVAGDRKTTKNDSSTAFASFDMPNAAFPKMEVPEAFRVFVQNSVTQATDMYAKAKSAAEEATNVLETTYATAAKGAADYNLKIIQMVRINTNATFNFGQALFGVTSFSKLIELSTAHARAQFETLTDQTKALTALAQQTAAQVSEPIKAEVDKALKKAA